MKFVRPNQFEKMRRLEGSKNPEDILDIKSFDEIKDEIEKMPPNIREFVEEHELNGEIKHCLAKTRAFCNELSEKFRQMFLKLLEEYHSERRKISPKITDYLLEKKFDLPAFTITHKQKAQGLLNEYGLDYKINSQNLLLIFQLPKPLSQF